MRFLLALAIVVAAACGNDIDPPRPTETTIAPATFAAVVAELAVARAELFPDTAAYRARVDQILARYEVTAQQLRTFVAGYGGNEDVVMAAYRLEQARLDSIFETGAVPAPAIGTPADTVAPANTFAPADTIAPGDTFAPEAPVPATPVPTSPDTAAPVAPETGTPAPADTTPGR